MQNPLLKSVLTHSVVVFCTFSHYVIVSHAWMLKNHKQSIVCWQSQGVISFLQRNTYTLFTREYYDLVWTLEKNGEKLNEHPSVIGLTQNSTSSKVSYNKTPEKYNEKQNTSVAKGWQEAKNNRKLKWAAGQSRPNDQHLCLYSPNT